MKNDGGSWGSFCATAARQPGPRRTRPAAHWPQPHAGAAPRGDRRLRRRQRHLVHLAGTGPGHQRLPPGARIHCPGAAPDRGRAGLPAGHGRLRGPSPADGAAPLKRRRAHLQALLDALDFPAFAVAPDWGIAGWNRAYAGLYSRIAEVAPARAEPVVADLHRPAPAPDAARLGRTSRHFVAEFRAEAGPRLGSAAHTALVAGCSEASAEFASIWADTWC